jgi:hypothetical protein
MLAIVRVHCLKLAVLLLIAPTCAVAAEEAPAAGVIATVAPTREEQLRELDEVVVRGKRLDLVIVEAEDDFYKLYNQLNKDDKYDVNCPMLNTGDRGSLLSSRVCMPGFVADAITDFTVYKINCEPTFENYDSNRDGRISRFEAGMNADLDFQFDTLDQDDDDVLNQYQEFRAFEDWARANLNSYRPPPPELVLMEGTAAWYQHMMKVTNSDPRLGDMAGQLDQLHQEKRELQARVRSFEANGDPREMPNMRNSGPRR